MKFKITILTLLASLALLTANAQTNSSTSTGPVNQVPDLMPSFPSTVASYFSSQNTNFTWVGNRFEVAVGADYISSVSWANYVKGQVDFGSFDVEGNFRNVGVGGAIQSVEAGAGYAIIQSADVKLTGYFDGGYDFNRKCALVEPGLQIRKKGTANTFFEAGISWPFWTSGPKNQYPDIRIGTGFTY